MVGEMVPEHFRGAESAAAGDFLDVEDVVLEQLLGEQDPLAGDPPVRGRAGARGEASDERAR